jgi:dihydropteroate synthase
MTTRLYLNPVAVAGRHCAPESALPLGGGPLSFAACEVARRNDRRPGKVDRETLPIQELLALDGAPDWLRRLSGPRATMAGLTFERPRIMGVINVTPDSFSDGGERADAATAVADGKAMWDAGATILDVGGESTRPGAEPVPVDDELRRVIPVVQGLAESGCRVSIDSRNARTMREAVAAGAQMINDVTGLSWDPEAMATVAELGVPVVLMHMQGTPQTMQQNPHYDDVALDIMDALAERVAACEAAGIPRERVAVDPGFGFGKTPAHNMALVNRLALFQGFGCPVLLGLSRKSTLAKLSRGEPPADRLPGSLAGAVAGAQRGAQILRVHDVAETAQALAVWHAADTLEIPADAV